MIFIKFLRHFLLLLEEAFFSCSFFELLKVSLKLSKITVSKLFKRSNVLSEILSTFSAIFIAANKRCE